MRQITVTESEAGQRFDKLLVKYLNEAPASFIYKMLRKKNITLNGKKAAGKELLVPGDEIRLYFSEETLEKFHRDTVQEAHADLDILYEDEDIILINKPAGMLSQKAEQEDISLVEYLTTYLMETGSLTKEKAGWFRPAVCNRLDRNTSGIVIAGKTVAGLQEMSRMLKDRSVHKYYRTLVCGKMEGKERLKGLLVKDRQKNQVRILPETGNTLQNLPDQALPIETEYRVLASSGDISLLEIWLITGRSHQIRAHLASIGHPIIGDAKYGNAEVNSRYRQRFGVKHQLLHAHRLVFPKLEGHFSYLSGREFTAPLPPVYQKILKQTEVTWQPGTPAD